MDLVKAILWRRSIRNYKSKQVEDSEIKQLLKAASWAPSAGNTQEWRFFVTGDPKIKEQMVRACNHQSFVGKASHLIAVGFDEDVARRSYGSKGTGIYGYVDCGAAIQNLMLRAVSLGLGTCWIGSFDTYKVSELMHIPKHVKLVAVITVGYPDEKPESRRNDLSEMVKWIKTKID